MRDEGEVGTARKNDEAPKRYLVVAKELENCLEFTKMKVLAEMLR